MRLRHILVDMTSPSANLALDAALVLAKRDQANVTGLFAYDGVEAILGMTGYMDAATVDLLIKDAEDAAAAKAAEARRNFDGPLQRDGITGECLQEEGNVASAFEQHARCADLTVFARCREDDLPISLAEAVLFGSGRPILVLPPVMQQPLSVDHVMIGWNGGREAARAVADALPLLRDAKSVRLVSIEPREDMKSGERSAQRLIRHLSFHGVTATAMTLTSVGVGPEELLLNAASESGAGLLVIGGYGHGRFREFVLGGVTRDLMRRATLPVLLSH